MGGRLHCCTVWYYMLLKVILEFVMFQKFLWSKVYRTISDGVVTLLCKKMCMTGSHNKLYGSFLEHNSRRHSELFCAF